MANIINVPTPLDGQGVLEYAGLVLQIVRTEEWVCEPDLDYSGVDYCLNHIVIGVRAVVNPAATATSPGQRAGLTMADVQQILMNPRQKLVYRIGPDVVVSSPLDGAVCDAKNGPKPLACRIIEVKGTKTAIIYFRIETWTGGPSNVLDDCPTVLSNRWSTEAEVDDNWVTRITTRGRMRVRTDAMQTDDPASPDIFRSACLPLPVPDGFKRGPINVAAKEDGTELMWSCVDQQQSLNLINGAQLGVCTIEGHYTTGSEVPYKDMKSLFTSLMNPLNLIPSIRNSFYIKLTGPPPRTVEAGGSGHARQDLLKVGIAVICDRFMPILTNGFQFNNGPQIILKGGLVSLYATISIQDVAVELRGEVFGGPGQTYNPSDFGAYVNMKDDMTGAAGAGLYANILNFKGATGANPNPPQGNTSRGYFIGALLEQALKGQYDLPASNAPSVGSTNVDAGGFE